MILFDYDPSRSQAVPIRLLENYRGYLQVDGYDGYMIRPDTLRQSAPRR